MRKPRQIKVFKKFSHIRSFFEDENFYKSIVKQDQKRLRSLYLKFYTNYRNFYQDNKLGSIVGEGNEKVVFSLIGNSNKVIKFYKTEKAFKNEKENYFFFVESNLEHLVPKMEFFDQYSIAELVEGVNSINFGKESNIELLKLEGEAATNNFGFIKGRTVLMDLGSIDRDYINKNVEDLKNINIIN